MPRYCARLLKPPIFVLLMLGLAAWGCDRKAVSPSNEIVVGAFLSLTGPVATFGQTTRDGILLAVKHQNELGGVKGKKIKLVIYDNQGKTQETGTVVTRLITADKVVAVLGEVASTQSLAAAPICQQHGVPMISPSSTNPQVTQVGDMIFRVCFIDPDQGYANAKFAFEHLKARKVAVLYDQKQAYSTGLADYFKKTFIQLGGEIVIEQAYSGGSPDYSAQLNSIKAAGPDAIFVPGYYTDVGSIAIQARRLGIGIPLLGGDGWESPELPKIAGDAIEGCYYSNHYAPEDQRPESRAYVKAYEEEYNTEPGALSALGYDAAKILFYAIERSPSLSGKDLAAVIAQTTNFPGVTGAITINKDRNAQKPLVMLKMEKGKPVFVTMIEPPNAGS